MIVETVLKSKSSVIYAYTRRALTHCSTWNEVHRELDFITQQLVDNGYSNHDIQCVTKKTLDQWYNQQNRPDDGRQKKEIKLHYRNFVRRNYKRDEAVFREVINNNVSATDPDSVVSLIIIYRNRKTSQLIMKKSPPADSDSLKRHSVVCRILCPANGCNYSYIGMTTASG